MAKKERKLSAKGGGGAGGGIEGMENCAGELVRVFEFTDYYEAVAFVECDGVGEPCRRKPSSGY